MNKIKIIIAYDDENIINSIVDIVKKIEDVEIVATSQNALDTYNKIIQFQPQMIFAKYDFGRDINGLDIIKKAKEILKENVPAFNFIATEIPKKDYLEAKKIIGDKMNTIIREQNPVRYNCIIEDYKEYMKVNI